MSPVVYVVNPVLAAVVTGEILWVVVGYPRSIILLSIRDVVGDFRDQPVCAHHLRDETVIPGAMDVERNTFHVLAKRLCKSERYPLEVLVNLIPRAPLGPKLSLLDECLAKDSEVVEVENAHCDTEATVHRDNLPCAVYWLGHFAHKGGCLGVLAL